MYAFLALNLSIGELLKWVCRGTTSPCRYQYSPGATGNFKSAGSSPSIENDPKITMPADLEPVGQPVTHSLTHSPFIIIACLCVGAVHRSACWRSVVPVRR